VAFAAALDALVHVSDLLATVRTCLANCCAGFAVVGMVIAVAAHEVDTRCASGGAVKHELDVLLLNMRPTFR
tara:strand:- start:3982 stop:4197 length:216 start_codon:yes stop_codon:yes gene_type:complete